MKEPKEIHKCLPLQGKSLARVILGEDWRSSVDWAPDKLKEITKKKKSTPIDSARSTL